MKAEDAVLENAGEIALRMANEGFRSVFEHILPSTHRGPKIYTFWVNLNTGKCKVTSTQIEGTDIFDLTAEEFIPSRYRGKL